MYIYLIIIRVCHYPLKSTAIPNLHMVETVDSKKLADCLNKAWESTGKQDQLNIMVQVNTSQEESKCLFVQIFNMSLSYV